MNSAIFIGLLLTFSMRGAQEPAKNYWYNATDMKISQSEAGGTQNEGPIPPHQLVDFLGRKSPYVKPYPWGRSQPYWRRTVGEEGNSATLSFDPTAFYHDFPNGFVVVIQLDSTNNTFIKIKAVSKEEFDKEYAKALKETQKKYTKEIQKGAPLPPPVCDIVSGYHVEKPEFEQ